MEQTRVYRGVPAEERRAERRARLMEAALDIMGTDGWHATTVRGVCQRAKLTPRFFYESFPDLEALAVAVFDDIIATATERVLLATAAVRDDDPAGKARAAIETLIREVTDDPRRARVAFVEALGSEVLMQRRLAAMRLFAELAEVQAQASYHPPPQEEPFVRLTAAVLVGGLAELLIIWLDGTLPITREQLIEDYLALFIATVESAAAIARQRARNGAL